MSGHVLGLDVGGSGVRCEVVELSTGARIRATRPWKFIRADGPYAWDMDLPLCWRLIGEEREDVEKYFAHVEAAGRLDCTWCSPRFDDRTIWLGRDPHRPIREIWAEFRHYD